MTVCPNCNHQNPTAAVQCEACYTPLAAMAQCPNCGAAVQVDNAFCGQCGQDLKIANIGMAVPSPMAAPVMADPLVAPDPILPNPLEIDALEALISNVPSSSVGGSAHGSTQLQQSKARLFHVQSERLIELPQGLPLIHLGKPNDRVPPDVDVSGLTDSEIVSRVHADIRIEADAYYLEDTGSSNGTYVNGAPLPSGNRYRLRPGDRIALGKGDKVSFLFQI
jgi:pSer/pThr/pTyr-binding forkhead associated (FHA) protein